MEYEIRFYYSKNKKNDILIKLDKIIKIKDDILLEILNLSKK